MSLHKLRLLKPNRDDDLQLAEWTENDTISIEKARNIFNREKVARMAYRLDSQGKINTSISKFCEESEIVLIEPWEYWRVISPILDS